MGTEERKRNKELIETLLRNTERKGIDELLCFMNENGMYFDPASSKYHSNYPGGLADHCLNVRETAIKLNESLGAGCSLDSITIVALCHDLSKLGTYSTYSRNVQLIPDDKTSWTKIKNYKANMEMLDQQGLSHGVMSAVIASRFIDLSEKEFVAIANHMGASTAEEWKIVGNAFRSSKLAHILSVADFWASSHLEITYLQDQTPWE